MMPHNYIRRLRAALDNYVRRRLRPALTFLLYTTLTALGVWLSVTFVTHNGTRDTIVTSLGTVWSALAMNTLRLRS